MYAKGDIVVWTGHRPCIARVTGTCDVFKGCYKLSAGALHDSCHFSNLRPATDSEKNRLGKKEAEWLENISGLNNKVNY